MLAYNKIKTHSLYFILLLFISTINKVQATVYPPVWKIIYKQGNDSKTNKQSSTTTSSKENKPIYNNGKIKNRHMSVYKENNTNSKKNNIDSFSDSSAYKKFLARLSVRKNSSEIYEKLFEKDFKDKEKKIKENKMMITEVDKRIARLENDYNKMVGGKHS